MVYSFTHAYAELNETNKKCFSRVMNKLLNDTFLIKGNEKDKNDYYFVLNYLDMINSYFGYMEIECIVDNMLGVIHIKSLEDRNKISLKKFDTVLILILRLMYFKKSKEASIGENIFTNLNDIDYEIKTTNIFDNEKKNDKVYEESLRKLKKYKLIDFTDNISTDMIIEILPTILILVNNNLEYLEQRINTYRKIKDGNENEETDEEINEY